jgi:hypothetical protein
LPNTARHESALFQARPGRIGRHSCGDTQQQSSGSKTLRQRVQTISETIDRFPADSKSWPNVLEFGVPLVRYPYLMFYKILHGEAVVLRIIHGARKEPWEDL